MTNYFEYGVNLTDNQKSKLDSAIRNKSPLHDSSIKTFTSSRFC